MASKIIAQMIIQGTAIFSRAFLSAYQQALHNAKAGGGGGAAAINKIRGKMATDEALKILNLDNIKNLDPKILETQFIKFFEANDPKKGGSFYIQSKIYRAKEAIEFDLKAASQPAEPEAEPGKGKDSPKKDDSDSSTSNRKR